MLLTRKALKTHEELLLLYVGLHNNNNEKKTQDMSQHRKVWSKTKQNEQHKWTLLVLSHIRQSLFF